MRSVGALRRHVASTLERMRADELAPTVEQLGQQGTTSAGAVGGVVPVQVKLRTGGSGGSATLPPTWTYDIFALDANVYTDPPMATSLAPYRWTSAGYYAAAPLGSIGQAAIVNGSWRLLWAPESLYTGPCAVTDV